VQLFAAAAPGVAPIAAGELRGLGVEPLRVTSDGVEFEGDVATVRRANVELRTASRVLVRLGSFPARTFAELERHAARLDWRAFVASGAPANFRVTARKSRLYHTGAIAERLAKVAGVTAGDEESAQSFVVRGLRDEWLVSADSSGAHLHRRGYRLASAKAPLRETLAAAAVLASGWDGESPLVDPFCGSGTICIEAAMLAAGQPPGAKREFAFQRWPVVTAQPDFGDLPVAGRVNTAGVTEVILGYDRDAGAIEAARANAARAGAGQAIGFGQQAISALAPPAGSGWIVTNPPYGVRVGEGRTLRDLYARFGAVLRERFAGWVVLFFSGDVALERAAGLRGDPVLNTENGGLKVRLMRVEV
jgi:putative N6-adenine-specific DNA methylase